MNRLDDSAEPNARSAAPTPTLGVRAPTGGTWEILLSNLIAIAMSVVLDWQIQALLAVFWCQNVVIGFFWHRRITQLRNFSTKGFRINGRSVEPTAETRRSTARFFALHFGLFHLVYFVFLISFGAFSATGWVWLPLIAASFVFSHRQSYHKNIAADASGKPNIGTMFFLPYARVFPMHLMVLLGGLLVGDSTNKMILIGFGMLKILADLMMHFVEHYALRRKRAT